MGRPRSYLLNSWYLKVLKLKIIRLPLGYPNWSGPHQEHHFRPAPNVTQTLEASSGVDLDNILLWLRSESNNECLLSILIVSSITQKHCHNWSFTNCWSNFWCRCWSWNGNFQIFFNFAWGWIVCWGLHIACTHLGRHRCGLQWRHYSNARTD